MEVAACIKMGKEKKCKSPYIRGRLRSPGSWRGERGERKREVEAVRLERKAEPTWEGPCTARQCN